MNPFKNTVDWDSWKMNADYPTPKPNDIAFCIYGEPNYPDRMISFWPKWEADDNGETPAYKLIDEALSPIHCSNAMEWVWEIYHDENYSNPTQEDVDKAKALLIADGFDYDETSIPDEDFTCY
tara:strand:+ start:220 stop:588 length:369 start_codon:yes stop_codon:yes gene_type:complete